MEHTIVYSKLQHEESIELILSLKMWCDVSMNENTSLQINLHVEEVQVYQTMIYLTNENEVFDIQIREGVPKIIKPFSLNTKIHQYDLFYYK